VNHMTGVKERVFINDHSVESCDIQLFSSTFGGEVPAHHRIGVEGTLHRISLIVHPTRSLRVRASARACCCSTAMKKLRIKRY
jgi:hypothetical protein